MIKDPSRSRGDIGASSASIAEARFIGQERDQIMSNVKRCFLTRVRS